MQSLPSLDNNLSVRTFQPVHVYDNEFIKKDRKFTPNKISYRSKDRDPAHVYDNEMTRTAPKYTPSQISHRSKARDIANPFEDKLVSRYDN